MDTGKYLVDGARTKKVDERSKVGRAKKSCNSISLNVRDKSPALPALRAFARNYRRALAKRKREREGWKLAEKKKASTDQSGAGYTCVPISRGCVFRQFPKKKIPGFLWRRFRLKICRDYASGGVSILTLHAPQTSRKPCSRDDPVKVFYELYLTTFYLMLIFRWNRVHGVTEILGSMR